MNLREMCVAVIASTVIAGIGAPAMAQAVSDPVATPATASPLDYKLGVSDKVRVTVYNEPTLSGEFPVSANGTIAFPLIGDVSAIGRTASELAREIEVKLADGYLLKPRVSIDVATFRPYYVLGEVNKPGEYPYSTGLTVLNAVATAQGFTYRADKKKVYIKSAGTTGEAPRKLEATTPVNPGDTIRIGERFF